MKSSLKNMVLVLTGIAAVMGGILALMHQVTATPIAEAESRTRTEALASVLPAFDTLSDGERFVLDGDAQPVEIFTAHNGNDLAGIAVQSWTAQGFSGEITVMVGFDPKGTVTGYKVLSHAETPGLGAKADTWFRDETGNRSILGSSDLLYLSKEKEGGIDGITAATITSNAFIDAINRARKAFDKYNSSQQ